MNKIDALKANGTFNSNSDDVRAENFQHGIFFDPHDLIQVKYEMIRSVEKEELSIAEAVLQYGFSRQTFYSCRSALDQEGINGLLPKKTGPKTGYKLDEEGKHFIDQYLLDHPRASTRDIKTALESERGVNVNRRTVDRYLAKK